MAHRLSHSVACGIILDQGSNPCLLHRQAGSLPLSHREALGAIVTKWFLHLILETLTSRPPCFSWFSLLTGCSSASFARLSPLHQHLNRAQSFDLFVSTYTPISLKASHISHVQCFCSNPDLSPAGDAHIQSDSLHLQIEIYNFTSSKPNY